MATIAGKTPEGDACVKAGQLRVNPAEPGSSSVPSCSARSMRGSLESSESLVKGLFVAFVCNECGSTVTRRLLYCSDDAALYHLECTNGHKHHRVASRSPEQPKDTEAGKPSPAFVIVESCDCT